MLLIEYAKLHVRHDLWLLAGIFSEVTPSVNLLLNYVRAAGARIVLEAAPEFVGTLLIIVLNHSGIST